MRQNFAVVAGIAVALCSAQDPNQGLRKPPMGYELCSWQSPNGCWSFCLLASPSGVNIEGKQVYDKESVLRGVDELNKQVSKLPVGATIYWLDHLTGSGPQPKDAGSLSYPPANIIGRVRRFAEMRHVAVELLDLHS